MNQPDIMCHPAFFTTAYPILKRIPVEHHQAIVRQSECGIPLTAEQAALFGLPSLDGTVLIPSHSAMPLTSAQLDTAFPPENHVAFLRALYDQREWSIHDCNPKQAAKVESPQNRPEIALETAVIHVEVA